MMVVDMRKEGCAFGRTICREEKEKQASPVEDSMQQFDNFLKENIKVLESTIGALEKK